MSRKAINITLVTILIIAILAAVAMVYTKRTGKPVTIGKLNITKGDSDLPSPTGDLNKPLVNGSAGDEVKWLQLYLNTNFNTNLTMDGDLGPLTLAAMKDNGIKPGTTIKELI